MSSALSDDGSRVIGETVEIHTTHDTIHHESQQSFDKYYKIEKTMDIILKNDYTRVALQFPDELLQDAVAVSYRLRQLYNTARGQDTKTPVQPTQSQSGNVGDIEEMGIVENTPAPQSKPSDTLKIYILGDTSYGSCCVDKVAAQHVDAEFIVHYGNACLQKYVHFYIINNNRVHDIPLFHVFGSCDNFDVQTCLDALDNYIQQTLGTYVVVLYHVCYQEAAQQLKEAYESRTNNIGVVVFATINPTRIIQNIPTENPTNEQQFEIGNLQYTLPPNEHNFKYFYIGEDTPSLTHMMIDNNSKQFARFSIMNNRFDDASQETSKISRMLKRRYYLINKAREVDVIGIIVATTSVGQYLEMIQRVKRLITEAGKKYYVFFVGKLNVPKLANFSEIDLFVLISCPQNSLIDSKEFLKPIVTPYELQMGLLQQDKHWTGEYISDFNKLLEQTVQERVDDEEMDYSFISGTMKQFSRPKKNLGQNEEYALVSASNREVMLSEMTPAMTFLQSRAYKGLDQSQETPVGVMVEGTTGIARGYENEKHLQ